MRQTPSSKPVIDKPTPAPKASESPLAPNPGGTRRSRTSPTEVPKAKPAVKTIPIKAAAPAPPVPVRVIVETTGAGGRAWRMNSRYAVAYLKDAALAGEAAGNGAAPSGKGGDGRLL